MTTNLATSALPLAGRHALVSGASRGIGAAVARELDALGARLTLLGRDRAALERTAAGLRDPCVVIADVADSAALATAVAGARAAAGPLAILVNNAGIAPSAPFLRTDAATWSETMRVNLEGTVALCREALPDMLALGWGRVVNIASTAGLHGYAYVSAYCASKHAVVGLTRALAMEFARKAITVNAICPGYVATELLERSIANIVDKTGCTPEAAAAQLRATNPQDRFVDPAEIAATVRWLCLPGAEAVTGQAIALAGGEIQ
jgi:NAD(P)-dependent dehydrogenase (short-subunit alcohol dehydrogenase family)